MGTFDLLKPGVVDLGAYFSSGVDPTATVWDEYAADNPIHAAISVDDEEGEAVKSKRIVDFLARELPEGRVVDLGCGYGRIAKYLLPRRRFETYIGVDGSAVMLKLFHERYAARPEEQGTPLLLGRTGIDDTLLRESTVDAVFSCAVLLHNPKWACKAAVDEAFRVLKPGGKLILVDSLPNRFSVNGLFGSFYELVYLARGERDRNGPVRYWRRPEVQRLCADFASVDVIRSGFAPLPKSLPGLRQVWNDAYRRRIVAPGERVASKVLPSRVQELACFSFDVVAEK